MRPGRDRDSLNGLLDEQLAFLRTSAHAFDRGVLPEYKRIALVLRVLLHDTGRSHSLLRQFGVKTSLRFWDTRDRPSAASRVQSLAPHDWPIGMVQKIATLSASPDPRGEGSWTYVPILGSDPERRSRKEFEAWWRDSILELRSGEPFTREDFVLGIAHHEGGAHVDPNPPPEWVLLRDQAWDDASGTIDANGQLVPVRYLVPAVVRQIGYEVAQTLDEQRKTLA
jgi:hypothetical protein